jgi:glycosyltransferase involved in cell wall biosynthesis
MSLAVVVPTLDRSHALRPLLEAFRQTTDDFRLVFVLRPDDEGSWEAVEELAAPDVVAMECEGRYAACVNLAARATDEDFLLIGADDIRPHERWFEAARAKMSSAVGFVSTNDLGSEDVMAGTVASHPLVARWYATEVGDLFDEAYFHNGGIGDASEVAKQRGAFAYAPDSIVEHLHPNYGKAEVDETYRRVSHDEMGNAVDNALLAERWPAAPWRWQ